MNKFILVTGLVTALVVAASGASWSAETGQTQKIETGAKAAVVTDAKGASGTTAAVMGEPARIEVAFVLDTTGSMGGLIDGAKRRIWGIADEIRKAHPNAEIRMGLVGYRDRGDAYVTKKTDLTSDISAVYGELIGFQAQGGGDWPESVNEALSVAVNGLAWTRTPETRRIVFLVGDAPPHMDYPQDVPFTDTLKIAEREGVIVDALQCGDAKDTELAWKTIAQLGHGRWVRIPQEGGVVQISTPWDEKILKIQIELNKTVVPYGSLKRQSDVRKKAEVQSAAPAPAASDMAGYAMRAPVAAERKVVTGEGDLVADAIAEKVDAGKIARDELPEELRGLSSADVKASIAAKAATRQTLQGELEGLVKQRDAHIAAEKAGRPAGRDGFDGVVEELVREQTR